MSSYYIATISNKLFDVYCSCKEAKVIWEVLIKKFTAEEANKQKFIVGRYYQWKMSDVKKRKFKLMNIENSLKT